jgi:hypothetical protein
MNELDENDETWHVCQGCPCVKECCDNPDTGGLVHGSCNDIFCEDCYAVECFNCGEICYCEV